MPISEIKYRLGEFIIIEHGNVLLTLTKHIALGAQLSGKCFIIGNILVIGNWEHEEPGYLKLEFHEHLMKLPAWEKTRYSCFASSLRKVETEQSITSDLLEQLLVEKNDMAAVNINAPSKFRLGRYEITVDENSIISWQTIGAMNRTIGGTCVIESGILFIGPKEVERDESQSKQDFFTGLKLLPQWDKTFAWGHYGSLMPCKETEPQKSYATLWNVEPVKAAAREHRPLLLQSQKLQKKKIFDVIASSSERLKTAWPHTAEWKVWVHFLLMIIAGVFFVLLFIFVLAVAIVAQVFSKITNRFQKHFAK